MTRRYSNVARDAVLTAPVVAGANTLAVDTTEGWLDPGPGDIAIGAIDYGDPALIEIFSYTDKTATSFTGVIRGLDGTTDREHLSGAKIKHVGSAADFELIHTEVTDRIADVDAEEAARIAADDTKQALYAEVIPAGATTAQIQAILNGGGTIRFAEGTFDLTTQGANPYFPGHRYCLEVTQDDTDLIIPKGTTLRLANGQQIDATGPVDILVYSGRKRVSIGGGGRITGNTAGQPGWTGGYAQLTNGEIICGYGAGCEDIVVHDLQLDDHFSNPCDMNPPGANRAKRVTYENLYAFNCGEGFQVIYTDGVRILNCRYEDPGNVAVGDCFELSTCTDFIIDGCAVKGIGDVAGGAFDLYGSKRGVLSNFLIDGWLAGSISASTTGEAVIGDDILVCDGVIRNAGGALLQAPDGSIMYSNIRITDPVAGSNLLQATGNFDPLVVFENIYISGHSAGPVFINGARNVHIINPMFVNPTVNTFDGITISGVGSPGDIQIRGGRIKGHRRPVDVGPVGQTGMIVGLDGSGCTQSILGQLGAIEIHDCLPAETSDRDNVAGKRRLVDVSSTLVTIGAGHKDQLLEIITSPGSGRTVQDKTTGATNINLQNSEAAVLIGNDGDRLWLQYRAAQGEWFEVARSYNKRGNRKVVGDGWFRDNVAAGLTADPLERNAGTVMSRRFYAPKDGYVMGIGVASSEARTAGSLTVEVYKNNGTTGKTAVLDASNTSSKLTTVARQNHEFNAGGYFEVRVTTTADWLPITADIIAWVELEM